MNQSLKNYIDVNIEKTTRFNTEDTDRRIGLPYVYTVPCADGGFQDLYYWDTYFTNVGLIEKGRVDLAKSNVDNMCYLVDRFGFMPNGSRWEYLSRSQPPFLSNMVKDVFAVTKDKEWLAAKYISLEKEYAFWQTKKMSPTGLNGYINYGVHEPALEGACQYFTKRTGYVPKGEITRKVQEEVFFATLSVCESGWDCTSRFLEDGHHYDAIDLNALLYGMEEHMQYFSEVLENGQSEVWAARKSQRLDKMQTLWSEEHELFMDYNFRTKEFSGYESVASFFPLFVGMATKEQAEKTMRLFEKIELEYGLACGAPNPAWKCQWDYPNVWAPLQYVVYKALMNYGYTAEAKRVAEKYVALVEANFAETGNLWEKYDGLTGKVASDEYEAPPMMGWTSGVYLYFSKILGKLL